MTDAPRSIAPPPTLDRATTGSRADTAQRRPRLNPRAIVTVVVFLAIIGLAIWYLVRPEPLLVQGEAESTRYRHRRAGLRPARENRRGSRPERCGGGDLARHRQS